MIRDNESVLNRFIKRIKGDDEVSVTWRLTDPQAQAYEVLKGTPARVRKDDTPLGERSTPSGKIERGFSCFTVVDAHHPLPELFTEVLIYSPDQQQPENIRIEGGRKTVNRVVKEVKSVVDRG